MGEDEKVISVEVDGMRDGKCRLYHDVCPFISVGKFNNCVGGVENGDVVGELQKGRLSPVNHHGGAVQEPAEDVVGSADSDGFEDGRGFVVDGFGNYGDEVGGRFVFTTVGVRKAGRGRGGRGGAVVNDATDVVGAVVLGAGNLGDGTHPEVGGDRGLIGSYDDVVALAWVESRVVSGE